jgi:hypothetical protein
MTCAIACVLMSAAERAASETARSNAVALVAPGIVSTGESETHATLSPDGKRLYFVKLTPDFAHWTIVVSEKTADRWSAPAVAPFSGRWDDADLSFAPDGNTAWLISDRPDGDAGERRADFDIFRMRRTGDAWSAPERVAELSSPTNEWFPNQVANGTLYFGSERRDGNVGPEGTADLWRARWLGERFDRPENLGAAVNGTGSDIEPWISSDESTLVFAAKGRADSQGSYDLYSSRRCGDAWTAPRPLEGEVNSAGWDAGGRFSPDGSIFYFGSNRALPPPARTLSGSAGYRELTELLRSPGNGLFDIYAVPAKALGIADSC